LVKYFDTRSLSGLRVEHATVTTDITHQDRGELQVQVTSPSGTTAAALSVLMQSPHGLAELMAAATAAAHHRSIELRGGS
jgi:pyrroline-5-carboxylate reductase